MGGAPGSYRSPVFLRGVRTRLFSVQSEVRASETLQCPLVPHCLVCWNHRHSSHTSAPQSNCFVQLCARRPHGKTQKGQAWNNVIWNKYFIVGLYGGVKIILLLFLTDIMRWESSFFHLKDNQWKSVKEKPWWSWWNKPVFSHGGQDLHFCGTTRHLNLVLSHLPKKKKNPCTFCDLDITLGHIVVSTIF